MRRISHHPDLAVLGLQQSILAGAGIASFVLNGNSWWLANGEVSLLSMFLGKVDRIQNPLFAPELCLAGDEDDEEAVAILKAYLAPVPEEEDWVCSACGRWCRGRLRPAGNVIRRVEMYQSRHPHVRLDQQAKHNDERS